MNLSRHIFPYLFPKYTWKRITDQKVVYLTFDDGPIPDITEWVLHLLEKYNIKATFFCIGDNVRKHPEVFRQIVAHKHRIGNHTFNHLNGWKNEKITYEENILLANEEMTKHTILPKLLFRPPYGKIKQNQGKELLKRGYEIIMWSHISKDYDKNISSEECYQNAISAIQPGSIIVFHDSIKAEKNMKYALPKTIEYLIKEGYSFGIL